MASGGIIYGKEFKCIRNFKLGGRFFKEESKIREYRQAESRYISCNHRFGDIGGDIQVSA
jgi:hypothetical protein